MQRRYAGSQNQDERIDVHRHGKVIVQTSMEAIFKSD